MKRFGYAIAFWLFLLVFQGYSQSVLLKFKHISYREGLAQSPVSCLFQDDQGFVWIGNWKGLTRYDGNEFRNFQHSDSDSSSISNNRVNSMLTDARKKLWVATANGLNVYDPQTETFRTIGLENIKGGKNYIASVITDHSNTIWAATFGGVKYVSGNKLKDLPVFNAPVNPDLYQGVTFTLFRDSQNTIWTGTKRGPGRFDPVSKRILELPQALNQDAELMNAKVLVIREDKSGNIWFGTESSGVFKYNPAQNSCVRYRHAENDPKSLCSDWIKDILICHDGGIWIGTRGGISILQKDDSFVNHQHQASDAESMNDSTVWSLMQDASQNIWIGTFAGGINLFYPGINNFRNIGERTGDKPGLNHPVVNAVVEDDDGSLWVGTYWGGINHIYPDEGIYRYYAIRQNRQERPTNGVKSISRDAGGNLWIGTLDGLYYFNKTTKTTRNFIFPVSEGKLSENLINTVLADTDGVWAGTNGGGLRFVDYDGNYTSFRHQEGNTASLSDNFVTALLKDDTGNLWVATQNGLNYYDVRKKRFTVCFKKRDQHSIGHNTVLTLFIDSKKRFWAGTEGGGLNYYDRERNRFYQINKAEGLPDDVVHAIAEDRYGNLWLSTDNGICKVDLSRFLPQLGMPAVTVTQYSDRDGLASNQFSTNASLLSRSGKLMFGGVNGLTVFSPCEIVKNRFTPNVVLTNLIIRNRSARPGEEGSPLGQTITATRHITLDYDQRFIQIRFAALNYVNPAGNQYAYMLEGLTDKEDWHYAGNQPAATYTNLRPGSYVFKVKAANNDGLWNEQPVTLGITVLPPWWMTWWAYSLYALVVAGAVFFVVRFFYVRAKLKRELFYEQLQNERQQEMYQLKLNFFTNVSHEIRTPLTLITGPLEKLLTDTFNNGTVHRQLLQVKNNADRLMRLVSELLDFRKAESGHMKLHYSECDIAKFTEEIFLSFQNLAISKNISYSFSAPEGGRYICFDKDQMEKVFFNLLSNAFKFTPDGGVVEVTLCAAERDGADWIDIIISDNGRGIPAESQKFLFSSFFQADDSRSHLGTGLGLALSKSIVELHQGELNVHSIPATDGVPGKTDFTVSLRAGKEHLGDSMLLPDYMNSDNAVHYRIQSEIETIIEPEDRPQTGEKKYSVLITEDNAEVRSFIRSALEDAYFIHESTDGEDGLECAFRVMPDLVISDVMMPRMDGLEFCRRLKTDERTNHIPVILLTARAAYIHQVNGLEHGADAYITKPFSIHILKLHIRNILDAKEVLREKFSRQITLQPKNVAISSPEEKFLQKLMEIIESNIDNDAFGVQELTEKIGMSKTVLYKKVQALTGLPVADYIKSVRLQKAAMMLKQNKLTIAEVAFAVGFTDRKYFSKEFRKQYSLSPTEYISQHCTDAVE